MSRLPEESFRPPERPDLTPDQQQWLVRSEALWRRAHAIAQQHPESDVSDLYHALRCLQLKPTQRLAAALQRGRLRTHQR